MDPTSNSMVPGIGSAAWLQKLVSTPGIAAQMNAAATMPSTGTGYFPSGGGVTPSPLPSALNLPGAPALSAPPPLPPAPQIQGAQSASPGSPLGAIGSALGSALNGGSGGSSGIGLGPGQTPPQPQIQGAQSANPGQPLSGGAAPLGMGSLSGSAPQMPNASTVIATTGGPGAGMSVPPSPFSNSSIMDKIFGPASAAQPLISPNSIVGRLAGLFRQ